MRILPFLLIPLAALAYVLWHIWKVLPFPTTWRWIVIAISLLAFLTMFLGFNRTLDQMPLPVASACYEIGFSTLFVMLYLFITFLLLDIARLIHVIPKSWLYHNVYTSSAILLIMLAVFIYGYVNYQHKERQPLTLTTQKQIGKEMKIVMMSDLHLGYHNQVKELARWVDIINAEQADLILIAGDIVDMSIRPLNEENMAKELRRLNAPVYACLGNHDYFCGVSNAQRFLAEANIKLLKDSMDTIADICLVGRDDRTNPHRKTLPELMKGIDKDKYVILLDHQPYNLEQAQQAGIDFQLSGHTHHGQLWPISWITEAIYECAYGEWQRRETCYYVTSGIGIWGGKFRIGTQSEYVVAYIKK